MSTEYTHIPRPGPEAFEFAHAVVHIVDTGASDPIDAIESTNEALAVAATATDDDARVTAAARLTRREAEASFIKGARVSNKILTALVSREALATLLPRFARRVAEQA